MTKLLRYISTRKPFSISFSLLALAAVTVTLPSSAAQAGDGMPIEGMLAVNFTRSTTSPGIFAVSANGIGNLSNVGNLSFQLQKTLDQLVLAGPSATPPPALKDKVLGRLQARAGTASSPGRSRIAIGAIDGRRSAVPRSREW